MNGQTFIFPPPFFYINEARELDSSLNASKMDNKKKERRAL